MAVSREGKWYPIIVTDMPLYINDEQISKAQKFIKIIKLSLLVIGKYKNVMIGIIFLKNSSSVIHIDAGFTQGFFHSHRMVFRFPCTFQFQGGFDSFSTFISVSMHSNG